MTTATKPRWNEVSEACKLYRDHGKMTDKQLAARMKIPLKNAVPRRRTLQVLMMVRACHEGYYTLTPLGRAKAGEYIKLPTGQRFKERTKTLRDQKSYRKRKLQPVLFP